MSGDDRWQRVAALFDRALALPESERQAMIRASAAPGDVQDEVLALLESHATSDGFLEPPSLLQPATEIGSYRIERVIGRGGMGVVYLASDTQLHRPAALKSLPPHLFRDAKMRARLRQEARAAAALSHPNIATVYALVEAGDQIFIASEYLEGPTLRALLSQGPLPQPRVFEIARAIAAGLQAAHDRGIVHRDLKPENVIITTAGPLKIVDFGLAQITVAAQDLASVTRITEAGTIAGTPPYMAPEQLLGQPTSARTDQFAFGVLLYELLTGRYPFGSGPLPTIIARTIAGEPEPADVAPDLWLIMRRAIEKNPDHRFPSMKDLVAALDAYATGTLGTARTSGTVSTSDTIGTRLGWWQTHQLVVALCYWFMVYPAWAVHKWTGRYGVLTFLATLAIVVVGGNVRLHLWFTSRTYPDQLRAHLARISRLVRAADVAFSLIMLATGLVIADAHTGWGALFVSFGLGAALAFLVIEPTTARAVFGDQPAKNVTS